MITIRCDLCGKPVDSAELSHVVVAIRRDKPSGRKAEEILAGKKAPTHDESEFDTHRECALQVGLMLKAAQLRARTGKGACA